MFDTAVAESGTRLQNFLIRAGLRGFPWKTASILYTISWGWLFVAGDINVLDEPLYVRTYPLTLEQGFAPWHGFIYKEFFDFVYPYFGLFVFFAFFIVGLCSFQIARRLIFLSESEASFVTLLVLVIPFNTARVSSMTIPYTLGLMMFFVAWSLLISSKKVFLRVLSLCLFFFSFSTHSLLAFFLVPVFHLFILSGSLKVRPAFTWLAKNIVIILLPISYIFLRAIFWTDNPNYHDLSYSKISNGVEFLFAFTVGGSSFFLLHHKFKVWNPTGFRTLGIGVLVSGVGSIAYLALGFYQPDLTFFKTFAITFLGRSAWLSRHQILQPFGMALLIVGLISLTSIKYLNFARFLKFASIGICLLLNACFGFEYLVDSKKQNEIIGELSISKTDSGTDSYVFIDSIPFMNARGRPYKESTFAVFIHRSRNGGEKDKLLNSFAPARISFTCANFSNRKWVLIQGPETHWQALKNWVSDGNMGFEVTIDDSPGACKPELMQIERVSGVIPILFYFTGAKN